MGLVNARLTIKPGNSFVCDFVDNISRNLKINEYVSPEGRPKPPGIGVNFGLGPMGPDRALPIGPYRAL